MTKIRTILIGLGTVNVGVLNILHVKRSEILKKYNLEFVIVGLADSSGIAIDVKGFDYQLLIDHKKAKKRVSELNGYIPDKKSDVIVEYVEAELLIESSAGNIKTGDPGLTIVRNALRKGCSVVLANKVPLVFAFDELHQLGEKNEAKLAFSATVCGGLPVINVLQRDLKLATLSGLRGILNATTNYILKELSRGGSKEEAILEAQRLGAAEADPSYDVDGYDTANKLFIIMKAFTDFKGPISEISIEGIQNVGPDEIQKAKKDGKKIKLLALAEKSNDTWKLSVTPVAVVSESFLGTCDGWEMGIELTSDLYESVAMKNYEADPVGTSAAVVRDAIDMFFKDKLKL
ncbi:homoserine dehydrogenase [soil metagenome]